MALIPQLNAYNAAAFTISPNAIALGTTGAYLLTKQILTPQAVFKTTSSPTSIEKEPLSPLFWKFFGTALLTASLATTLFSVCPPAAIGAGIVAGWLLSSSGLILIHHIVQYSDSRTAQAVRWAHAMMFEFYSSVACVGLFPATLFSQFHEPKGNPHGRPILMIHGYLSFGSTWYYMRKRLVEAGYGPIYTMNIGNFDSIKDYAAQVQTQVKKIQKETGRRDLAFVCHSKGGLVGAYYATHLAASDGAEVTDIVTLGSPLAGTRIAKLGMGKDAQEMSPDHQFNTALREKISQQSGIRFFHLASELDEVVPLKSALLGNDPSRQKIFKDLGHLGLVFSAKVSDQVCIWLKS